MMDKGKVEKAVEKSKLEISFLNEGDGAGKSYTLKKPLSVNGKPLTFIDVPVKVTRDLAAFAGKLEGVNSMPDIIAAYCEIDVQIIDALHFDDYEDLSEVVLDFLPRSMSKNIKAAKTRAMDQATQE